MLDDVFDPLPGVMVRRVPCLALLICPPRPGVDAMGGFGGPLELDFITRGCGADLAVSRRFDADGVLAMLGSVAPADDRGDSSPVGEVSPVVVEPGDAPGAMVKGLKEGVWYSTCE